VQERVVIVTGAASGIGAAIAERLGHDGWLVAAADIDQQGLARGENAARRDGISMQTFPVDVSVQESVSAMVDAVHYSYGRIDALVNNAGIIGTPAPIWEVPELHWEHILAVDLNSVYYCSRAVVPHMLLGGWGRIVNIASIAGKEGNPNAAAYSTAKAGVIGLTKSMAKELATKGVLVNCVTPAEIDTPILGRPPQPELERWLSRIPMARLGQPREVAALVAWLVSEECSFSTGAVFDISGGRSTY
jgi:2-dehydro-3-deoxy-L-rhamnonate dehydrogenase (NAD+)